MKKSELLLPVGNMEMCVAAIHGGADAIYVGMPGFNARGRTHDHTLEELKEIIDLCHLYGVKVHVAFNILLFESEIPRAISLLEKVIPLGPDAFIVQDLGLATIIRKMSKDQVIHASTQMTITNHDAMELLDDLNIDRFVLGRENSIKEIKEIRKNTEKELEVFVHGALCVAYSGQCFTSESIGGRSANRGQCAQSCRFSYELHVDGKLKDLVDKEYLVSPQDLCGIEEVKELQEIGVESFKIEGRLKSPSYVATAANTYKRKLEGEAVKASDIEKMALTYSRGFFSGWLHGVDHQQLVEGSYQSHRGIPLGRIQDVTKHSILIETDKEIENGMGIGIYNDLKKTESGSPVFSVRKQGRLQSIELDKKFNLGKVSKGDKVYLTSSPKVHKEVEKMIKSTDEQRRIDIKVKLVAHVGSSIELHYTDGENLVKVTGDILEPAKNSPDLKKVNKEISALSRTPYLATKVELDISNEEPFIPNKVIKNLRQECVKKLNEARVSIGNRELSSVTLVKKDNNQSDIKINILLRNIDQVKEVIEYLPKYKDQITIILDFEFGKDYREALELLRNAQITNAIATNRILKPGEYHHLNLLTRLKPDFILARNLGSFNYLKKKDPSIEIKGDFSLNIANSQTATYLLEKGFQSVCTSYDLNATQLESMLESVDSSKIEVTVHQYMPSFHMEHCVFAAFLSTGSSFKDCGKPCEEHQVELKDQFGNRHFIKADQECRNTMFNAKAQSASSLIKNLKESHVSNFRIEMLEESGEELKAKLEAYIQYILEEISLEELNSKVSVTEKYGLGSGQLFKDDTYQARKQ